MVRGTQTRRKHHRIAVISNIQKKPFKCMENHPVAELCYRTAFAYITSIASSFFIWDFWNCKPFANNARMNRRHLLVLRMHSKLWNQTDERIFCACCWYISVDRVEMNIFKLFWNEIYRKYEARNSRIEKYEELTEIEPIYCTIRKQTN